MAPLTIRKKFYWDACAWIGLIQREPGRFDSLEYVMNLAKDEKAEIWTSTFTLAEVFKRPCNGAQSGLLQAEDEEFEDFIVMDFVKKIEVDSDIGILARRLLRKYPSLKKPQDAIHLASALMHNVDELHTFDRPELMRLSGVIEAQSNLIVDFNRTP
jgi:predicted nucleic acid-binding protein